MEFLSLGSDFQADKTIETYESLIWTERYRESGDFELKTKDIAATLTLLPRGSLVTTRNDEQGITECMIVETHMIEQDPDGESVLTVTGRSFETFFENRVARQRGSSGSEPLYTVTSDSSVDWKPFSGTGGEASGVIAGYIIENASMIVLGVTPVHGQLIPNFFVNVAPSAQMPALPQRLITVKPGTVYERVQEILAIDDLGIRTNLPLYGTAEMNVYIFKGEDKTASVSLSVKAGHFGKTTYYWSDRDYKNMAFAYSYYDWLAVDGSAGATGLNRRIGFLDATDIKSTAINMDDVALGARGAAFLKEHPKQFVFGGEVLADIPYTYWTDYKLGDLVNVKADYGVNQTMRVTEYIRVHDTQGDRAYPALSNL